MIEIIEYKQKFSGALQAIINIKIPKWGNFIIREISYFKKDNQRWISFPSRQYEKDGQKKYYSFNIFEDPETTKAFQQKVLEALDLYLTNNSQSGEIPF